MEVPHQRGLHGIEGEGASDSDGGEADSEGGDMEVELEFQALWMELGGDHLNLPEWEAVAGTTLTSGILSSTSRLMHLNLPHPTQTRTGYAAAEEKAKDAKAQEAQQAQEEHRRQEAQSGGAAQGHRGSTLGWHPWPLTVG